MGLFGPKIKKITASNVDELASILGDYFESRVKYYENNIIPKIAESQKEGSNKFLKKTMPGKKLPPKSVEAMETFFDTSLVWHLTGMNQSLYFNEGYSIADIKMKLLHGMYITSYKLKKQKNYPEIQKKVISALTAQNKDGESGYIMITMIISDEMLDEEFNSAVGYYTINFLIETFYEMVGKVALFLDDFSGAKRVAKYKNKYVKQDYLESFGNPTKDEIKKYGKGLGL